MAWLGSPFTDLSSSIASGAAGQVFAPADTSRRHLRISNPSTAALQGIGAAESLWINDKGRAASSTDGKSFELPAGASFEWNLPPTTAVSVFGATAGHKFEGAAG
jgi:hypothetical protein